MWHPTEHGGDVASGSRSDRARPSYVPPETFGPQLVGSLLGALSPTAMKYAPDVLHVAGDHSLLAQDRRRVAVVGSRTASPEGIRRARRLSRELAQAGVVVVSGLAEGIDRAAHEAAIKSGGRTIAVIGTPLDRAYPASSARLQEEIWRDHLLVSQFDEGARVYKSNFVKRNRTMALVVDASVVVEASDRSGTLSQAAETQRLGRPLFFLRSALVNPDLEWPHRFMNPQRGCPATPLESTEQILRAIE